ncbi:MAG: YIP1 family protein [Candidatus Sericytochromatia bacterium]|nr:YIP1 family protein [Candidatus Sericytochromatia bacterium]
MFHGLFQTAYLTLFDPASAFAMRAQKAFWWQAASFVWLAASLLSFSQSGASRLSAGSMALGLVLSWGSLFLIWWLSAMLLHFSAELFGGQGKLSDTMTATGLALLPLIFIAPLKALPNILGKAGYTLSLLGWMGICFWVLALTVMGLSAAQKFSLDRSIGSLILGLMLAAALLTLSLVLLGLQLIFWGAQLAA